MGGFAAVLAESLGFPLIWLFQMGSASRHSRRVFQLFRKGKAIPK
jgi:hypothetical protein